MTDKTANKMWGGRFTMSPAEVMEEINASIGFDKASGAPGHPRLQGARRHAGRAGHHLQGRRPARSSPASTAVLAEIESGKFAFSRALEDVHMNVESRLKELIGEPAGRLHTARSRNDQVATDFRLYVRDWIDGADAALAALQLALARKAEAHARLVMPGFTHLQPAQPVTFGHHLLAYVEMLARDRGRLADARARLNECPLGSAALAGTSFPIDRHATAEALGFDRPTANSLDAVSDRDFALETLAAAAIAAMHLSRFAEEIVIWMTPQFGFVRLSRQVHHRLLDHAAEAQPGCGRAGARQGRAHRRRLPGAADRHEGAAARLRQGHAGGQGGDLRRAREPAAWPLRP